MHKPEFIQENVMHKNLLDFEIPADHQISSRKLNLVLINKKKELFIS